MKLLALVLLRGYKRYLSPALPIACRYVPTCSDYAMEAVERNGIVRGGVEAIGRLLRCNPWGGHGYDPVICDCEFHGNAPGGAPMPVEEHRGRRGAGAPRRLVSWVRFDSAPER